MSTMHDQHPPPLGGYKLNLWGRLTMITTAYNYMLVEGLDEVENNNGYSYSLDDIEFELVRITQQKQT